jgi:hypothetical protein
MMMLRNRSRFGAALGLCTLILSWPAARSQSDPIPYQLLPVAGLNTRFASPGTVADPVPEPGDSLAIDGLNDQGQLLFSEFGSQPALVEYSGGHFIPIALPLGAALGGFWPPDLVLSDGSINQQGEVAFAATGGRAGDWLGVFVWGPKTQQSTPVALSGLSLALPGPVPAAAGRLFLGGPYAPYYATWSIPYYPPRINNHGEVAFVAPLTDANGNSLGVGLFLRDRDGRLMPIARTGDMLPVAGAIDRVTSYSLNDAGVLAFVATSRTAASAAFIWEKGQITPVAPGGKALRGVGAVWVNDANQNLLLIGGSAGFSVLKGDQLTPVVAPGQMLPGGGVFDSDPRLIVGAPNTAGQALWTTRIREGNRVVTTAYRLDADGQLSLVARDGDTTAGGETITLSEVYGASSIFGVVLNGKGQFALPVAINADPLARLDAALRARGRHRHPRGRPLEPQLHRRPRVPDPRGAGHWHGDEADPQWAAPHRGWR